MRKQFIFKDKYVQKLKSDIVLGNSIEFYRSNEFVYDKNQILMMPNIESTPDLVNQLDIDDDIALCQGKLNLILAIIDIY